MFAPTFVSSKETKDTLMQEESLKKLFSLFNYCDIILGSVGLMANSTSSLKEQQQFLNPRDYSELKEKGAVGNIYPVSYTHLQKQLQYNKSIYIRRHICTNQQSSE